MKRIGLVTRDCAGMNAVIRSVVRSACDEGLEVIGIRRGYEGLIDGDIEIMNHRSVSGIINLGGTILKTARSKRFKTKAGILKAIKTIKQNKIDGLIVAGGNGSLTGAHILASNYSIPVIGIPSTIDNDVNGVDMTIGADTAINVALDAIDKIRDTATSLERIFVVEVMGRDCGYIALRVALAGGCEEVILPEKHFNIKKISNEIIEANLRGKISWIIIVAEGKAKAMDISDGIFQNTGLETRTVVLGHIQRGGRPTAYDRILAARYSNYAVKILKNGESDKCIALNNDKLTSIPLAFATQRKDSEVNDYYKLIKILT